MAKKMQKTQTRSRARRPKIAARNGITKTHLGNGLSVILKESHNAPVVTFWVWYRVGSRMERGGITGISHWVEHMLFKGTPTFPKSKVDKAVAREGGLFNGFTWLDFTTYFETLPAGKWELGARIEADRMVNALFAPKEVEAERTVVISERQGNENNPQFLLGEEVQAAAFRVHPYHHEVIGNLCDLLAMTRDDLYTHYRRYYVPNNAIVVAVGDFKTAEALGVIEDCFGRIEPGENATPSVKEPPQRGERRVQVQGPGSTAYISVVYQALPGDHPDFPAMVVMDTILGGASSLAVLGGGGSNASSRLYRALVDTELGADVSTGLSPTVDPFLYGINVTVRGGRDPAQAAVEQCRRVEAALDAELERIVQQPVTEAEIAKAIKQAKAMFAYGAESVTNQGFWYGFSEIFADYAWFESYLERLASVSVDDVQRAARTYLTPQRRTVGWYLPTTNNA
jgi:zinc protease